MNVLIKRFHIYFNCLKAKQKGLQLLNTRLICVYSEATAPIVSLGLTSY